MAATVQEERVAEDPWADILRDFLGYKELWNSDTKEIEITQPVDRVHTSTLLSYALNLRSADQLPAHTQRLRVVMEKILGWKHKTNVRAGPDGKQGKGYQKSDS